MDGCPHPYNLYSSGGLLGFSQGLRYYIHTLFDLCHHIHKASYTSTFLTLIITPKGKYIILNLWGNRHGREKVPACGPQSLHPFRDLQ